MIFLEFLAVSFVPKFAKTLVKLWLPEKSLLGSASESVLEMLGKAGEDLLRRRAQDRLFDDLAMEVAKRIEAVVNAEFHDLPPADCEAAAMAVSEVLGELKLSREMMKADLNAAQLERIAASQAIEEFRSLGGDARRLADVMLGECCAYAITLAGKLPDFQVVAARELLTRQTNLFAELTGVIENVKSIRDATEARGATADFETRYRRVLADKLDRMQLFGLRLAGAGAREYGLSIAYVALSSRVFGGAQPNDVESCLSGYSKLIIRGEAGSGKTTLLQWLAVRTAQRNFGGRLSHWHELMPFYVRLRDYADEYRPLPHGDDLVENIAPILRSFMPDGWPGASMVKGAVLLVDGIDELPASRRGSLVEWLLDMASNFDRLIVVVSSRPAAIDAEDSLGSVSSRLARNGFVDVTLEPMSLPQSEALISQWHMAVGRELVEEDGHARLERHERQLRRALRDRPAIRGLASNPLLCAMICALNWDRQQRLPDDRMELYRIALEMLIDRRDSERSVRPGRGVELDRSAKEAVLDAIAFWMLRNGHTESSRADVEEQVQLMMPRLSKVQHAPADVLQELLERSGVIREPQFGIVDFIHRTFLEYMAARAAVNGNDLGLIVEQASKESWRETIVFAAGHAKNAMRDRLVGQLLRSPLLSFGKRSIEADITAACCLETAGENLDPVLLAKLRDCAKGLFPPRNVNAAHLLAPAAGHNPSLLAGWADQDAQTVLSCVRCAAMVGGDAMLSIIESYAEVDAPQVWDEMLSAWPAFDEASYLDRVIKRLTKGDLGSPFRPWDEDTYRYMMMQASGGVSPSDYGKLERALRTFADLRELDFSHGQGAVVLERSSLGIEHDAALAEPRDDAWELTVLDATRVARMKTLRSLTVGRCEPGVMDILAKLPAMAKIHCVPLDLADLTALTTFPALADLTISGMVRSIHSGSREIDLTPLRECAALRRLSISGARDRSVRFAAPPELEVLHLTSMALESLPTILRTHSLRELSIPLKFHEDTEIDFSGLENLTSLIVTASEEVLSLRLPAGLTGLAFPYLRSLRIPNIKSIKKLAHLALGDAVGGDGLLRQLLSLETLESIKLHHLSDEALTRLLKAAQATGVDVFIEGPPTPPWGRRDVPVSPSRPR